MDVFFSEGSAAWRQPHDLPNKGFVCGYCNTTVSSVKGYKLGAHGDGSGQRVGHVPKALNALFEEARRCTGQNCYTGAVCDDPS